MEMLGLYVFPQDEEIAKVLMVIESSDTLVSSLNRSDIIRGASVSDLFLPTISPQQDLYLDEDKTEYITDDVISAKSIKWRAFVESLQNKMNISM
jgi:hypothetical protein